MELERVADQVLEDLAQLNAVADHDRERADLDRRPDLRDARLEIDEDLARNLGEVDRHELATAAVDAREIEQVADQVLHAAGRSLHAR